MWFTARRETVSQQEVFQLSAQCYMDLYYNPKSLRAWKNNCSYEDMAHAQGKSERREEPVLMSACSKFLEIENEEHIIGMS